MWLDWRVVGYPSLFVTDGTHTHAIIVCIACGVVQTSLFRSTATPTSWSDAVVARRCVCVAVATGAHMHAQRRACPCAQIRALAGCTVHFEITRTETHTIPDGTETTKDAEGNTVTKQRMTAVQVQMYYHRGTVRVGANRNKPYSAGFSASINYSDGHGRARAPHTGQVHEVHGSCSIGASRGGDGCAGVEHACLVGSVLMRCGDGTQATAKWASSTRGKRPQTWTAC